jgi:hypothetical protein
MVPRGLFAQRVDTHVKRLVVQELIYEIGKRADIRLAHDHASAGAQHPCGLGKEATWAAR